MSDHIRILRRKTRDVNNATDIDPQENTSPEPDRPTACEINVSSSSTSAEPSTAQSQSQPQSQPQEDERGAAIRRFNERWIQMRDPPPGHIHNTLCPFWQVGDTSQPRPECLDRTSTMFDINPFTKEGLAHKARLDERDRLAKEKRDAKI